MPRTQTVFLLCILVIASAITRTSRAQDSFSQRIREAMTLWQDAELPFTAPDPQWYETTRNALSEEASRVEQKLESHGEAYADAWKRHLQWPLLMRNLGEPQEIEYSELALVRRWLYSNRKGLEYPFFAELRQSMDAHLDAAYACSHPTLEAEFHRRVADTREHLETLAADPSDRNTAALARTLGWLDRCRQLPELTAATRRLISLPNAQIVIGKPVVDRTIALLASDLQQSLPVSDRLTVPNGSLLGQPRVANVNGTAKTRGEIAVGLQDNPVAAEIHLEYQGSIESLCRAVVGPVSIAMRTTGPVEAITPVGVNLQGITVGETEVALKVKTRVTGVSARSDFIRRIGERRVHEPDSLRQMNSRASMKAKLLMQEEMEKRVNTAIDDIRAELQKSQESLDQFQEVFAPVVREGATPRWENLESSNESITVNVAAGNREQFGAVIPHGRDMAADMQICLHVSFFNNMLETIMAGKTFTDKYFMRYARILQPQLPPPLMVHSRSTRWAIIAAKPRPLEITIPASNVFRIQLNIQRVEIDGEEFVGPTTATIYYQLQQSEFGDYYLQRQGEVELDSSIPVEGQSFLQEKLAAFFAPVLDGTGVALPEGGTLGRMRNLQPQGAWAHEDWLTLGINVPNEFLEAWLPSKN
ncbi:MAG: hypothetical protein RH917_00510 [Lacipirellulaceae bacterium]